MKNAALRYNGRVKIGTSVKSILALGIALGAFVASASARDDVLRNLRNTASSRNYYWAWTNPWLNDGVPNGDDRLVVWDGQTPRPKPTDSVKLGSTYQKFAGGTTCAHQLCGLVCRCRNLALGSVLRRQPGWAYGGNQIPMEGVRRASGVQLAHGSALLHQWLRTGILSVQIIRRKPECHPTDTGRNGRAVRNGHRRLNRKAEAVSDAARVVYGLA